MGEACQLAGSWGGAGAAESADGEGAREARIEERVERPVGHAAKRWGERMGDSLPGRLEMQMRGQGGRRSEGQGILFFINWSDAWSAASSPSRAPPFIIEFSPVQ